MFTHFRLAHPRWFKHIHVGSYDRLKFGENLTTDCLFTEAEAAARLALEQGGGAAAEGVSLKHAPLRFIVQSG
jgi:hypothetical protein